MASLNHIYHIDTKEELILFKELILGTDVPLVIHSCQSFSKVDEFVSREAKPKVIFLGSGIIIRKTEKQLIEFCKKELIKSVPLMIFTNSESYENLFLETPLPNAKFFVRPFDLVEYQKLIRTILLPLLTFSTAKG